MSGLPAVTGSTTPSVLVLDGGEAREVFEVIALVDGVVRVRAAFLFEIGEELLLRIEQDGEVTETAAHVRAHVREGADLVTELELGERTEPKPT